MRRWHPVAVTMDRAAWLRERRAAVEADYDRDAPTYDFDRAFSEYLIPNIRQRYAR